MSNGFGTGASLTDVNSTLKNVATNISQLITSTNQFAAALKKPGGFFNVVDFGAKGDGDNDDTVAIQNAVNKAQLLGGVVYFPPGAYSITDQILVSNYNVKLIGAGGGDIDGIDFCATKIIWNGAASPTKACIKISSPDNAAVSSIWGGGVVEMGINANALAGYALEVQSLQFALFEHLYLMGATDKCFYIHCLPIANTSQGTNENLQLFRCICQTDNYGSAGDNAVGFYFGGSFDFNTVFCTIMNCTARVSNGAGYKINDADNNMFINCRGGITGTGLLFDIDGNSIPSNTVTSDNEFIHCDWPPNGFKIRGTDDGFTTPAQGIIIHGWDYDNSIDPPILGTGARAYTPDGPWIPYAPVATSDAGTLTDVTASGVYLAYGGGLVQVNINVQITTNGSGAGGINVTVPFAASGAAYSVLNGANTTDGITLCAFVGSGNDHVQFTNYDSTYPGADGKSYQITGWYMIDV